MYVRIKLYAVIMWSADRSKREPARSAGERFLDTSCSNRDLILQCGDVVKDTPPPSAAASSLHVLPSLPPDPNPEGNHLGPHSAALLSWTRSGRMSEFEGSMFLPVPVAGRPWREEGRKAEAETTAERGARHAPLLVGGRELVDWIGLTSPVLLSQRRRKGAAGTIYTHPRGGTTQETTMHAPSGASAHVIANPALPRDIGAGGTDRRSAKKKRKERKGSHPKRTPASDLKWGLASSEKEKEKHGKLTGEESRRVERRDGSRRSPSECYKSNSTSAAQATRIETRGTTEGGRSKGGRRKKGEVTRDRFFEPSLFCFATLSPATSSPALVAFVALLTELPLWHSPITTPLHPATRAPLNVINSPCSVAWVATRGACGGWHHNSEFILVFPKVQWDSSSHCRCISPTMVFLRWRSSSTSYGAPNTIVQKPCIYANPMWPGSRNDPRAHRPHSLYNGAIAIILESGAFYCAAAIFLLIIVSQEDTFDISLVIGQQILYLAFGNTSPARTYLNRGIPVINFGLFRRSTTFFQLRE
ncbi:hypothetical protein B0H14DRAFT_2562231 [Mycena olivaceomarginata]|nr:hypothetical protein B0H14DRAFT_2562231 [Mycena olivaceomarginata]